MQPVTLAPTSRHAAGSWLPFLHAATQGPTRNTSASSIRLSAPHVPVTLSSFVSATSSL